MAEEGLDGARRHAGALPGLIARVLADAGVRLPEVEAVVLGDGPGSFTGLRVGASVAKALVRSRGVSLHAVPALAAVAWAARPAPAERVLAVANALRGEVYAAEFRFPEGRVEVLQEPTVWLPEQLLSNCPVPDVVAGVIAGGTGRAARGVAGRAPPAPRAGGGLGRRPARAGRPTGCGGHHR